MNRAMLRKASICARNLLLSSSPASCSTLIRGRVINTPPLPCLHSTFSNFRLFSSENDSSSSESETKPLVPGVEDVSNKDLKGMIEKYFGGDEEVLEDVFDAVVRRRITGKHEDSDAELLNDLENAPIGDIKDEDFDKALQGIPSDSEEDVSEDLYNAREMVMEKMTKDDMFSMDDHKWDDMIKEAVDAGIVTDTKGCEQILEDMLNWEKLVPAEVKKKLEDKFNEVGEMVERGEVEVAQGYEIFKEFEDRMIFECAEKIAAETPKLDDDVKPDSRKYEDDPPGEGPILRWHTRVVFMPGDEAWHPKNRRVKMGVTVKELGLTKPQFCRLRELVGKRYHPGKDELMITSERFEHREENRKDCLRTLYALIEEAGKAKQLVEDARTSYVKEKLKANPAFMARLKSKTASTSSLSA